MALFPATSEADIVRFKLARGGSRRAEDGQARREIIERQVMAGGVAADEVNQTNVVNLMDALRGSLGDAGGETLQKNNADGKQEQASEARCAASKAGGVMAIQLPFPVRWAQLESRRGDTRGRLDRLRRDVLTTKAVIRSALDELAKRHGISRKDVDYAVEGYADDMLSDAIYNVERTLEGELEHEDPV